MTMPQLMVKDEQATFEFAISQGRTLETEIYRRRYPSFDYAAHVPVVTQGAPWAIGTQFRVKDHSGKAKVISGKASDIPFGKTTQSLASHDFVMIGAGWEWSDEEVNQAQLYGIDLSADDAMGAADDVERLLYTHAMTGDTELNWTGLVNNASVQTATAANTGTGSSTFWSAKSVDQVLTDVNTGLSTVRTNSNEVEWADTVRLPPEAFRDIAVRRMGAGDGAMTVLDYIRKNNIYTAETGQPLDIAPLRDLAEAGTGERGRMVAYRKDPQVLRFHLPMPRRVLPVYRSGLMSYQQAVIARTGGLEIRLPGAMSYIDGITAEPS